MGRILTGPSWGIRACGTGRRRSTTPVGETSRPSTPTGHGMGAGNHQQNLTICGDGSTGGGPRPGPKTERRRLIKKRRLGPEIGLCPRRRQNPNTLIYPEAQSEVSTCQIARVKHSSRRSAVRSRTEAGQSWWCLGKCTRVWCPMPIGRSTSLAEAVQKRNEGGK